MIQKRKGDRVTNVNPFHAEIKITRNNGFELWLVDKIGGDYCRRHIVKVHFEDWWIKVLASFFWKVILRRKEENEELESSMLGK